MKTPILISLLTIVFCTNAQTYTDEEVAIGELKGTLSVPNKPTDKAILIIAGSGPTDRDGNSAMGLNNNSLKMVGKSLANAGYAVLRFDKRGIAASKPAVKDPSTIRFDDFVKDVRSWIVFLAEKGYAEVVILGHSQGSLAGILASIDDSNVQALVSLAGLAEDAGEAIVRQLSAQAPALGEEVRINIDSMKAGHTVKQFNPFLASIFGPQIQPFLKSYIKYIPAEEIKKLSIPLLIVNGTSDLQVGPLQAQKLKEAYPTARMIIIENMNHVLKKVPEGDLMANSASYNNPSLELHEALMPAILTFLNDLK